jgi:phage head maturation protease
MNRRRVEDDALVLRCVPINSPTFVPDTEYGPGWEEFAPEAFAGVWAGDVQLRWAHEQEEPVSGQVLEVSLSDAFLSATVLPERGWRGDRFRAAAARGALGVSIGFVSDPRAEELQVRGDRVVLRRRRVQLVEVSGLPSSMVAAYRSAGLAGTVAQVDRARARTAAWAHMVRERVGLPAGPPLPPSRTVIDPGPPPPRSHSAVVAGTPPARVEAPAGGPLRYTRPIAGVLGVL